MIAVNNVPARFTNRVVVIGRHNNCDVQPLDSTCSRYHVLLAVHEHGITVHALETLNGTYLNNVLVRPAEEVEAKSGDILICGHTMYLLNHEIDEAKRPTLVISYAADELKDASRERS